MLERLKIWIIRRLEGFPASFVDDIQETYEDMLDQSSEERARREDFVAKINLQVREHFRK